MYQYLSKTPFINNKGNPIKAGKLKTISSITRFNTYIRLCYVPFLKVLKLLNIIVCNHYETSYARSSRKVNRTLHLAELYKPYVLFETVYDDANAENLRIAMRSESGANAEMFDFDPKSIQWEEYFINTHFPGIVKYVLKK
ncbi:hypothetical protein ABFS82_14G233800 [Erythranthe guttata]|uniref:Fatty acyl-CoA reductase C-terminal domain-containing protein n=1 Tax=Erythranthe guttata TaxID=4155 RepID=A0A022RAX1_ERYGU|nr:PREDICTED: alcohol-forming fatty acyl-CoA reductase-like [Erythranthe guttata]EYU36075.1 hypothetical protein MIMGU_mgv1a015929mg [Erythranthe guttata]|eukprot:XP_012838539.1 PREDICTED: alcohol-forming fatty acyl-CoA reductase-like [Erythranthe guttata]